MSLRPWQDPTLWYTSRIGLERAARSLEMFLSIGLAALDPVKTTTVPGNVELQRPPLSTTCGEAQEGLVMQPAARASVSATNIAPAATRPATALLVTRRNVPSL